MRPTKILVPVDGSVTSKNAAKYAANLANKHEIEIVLLHVYGPVSQLLTGDGLHQVKEGLEKASLELIEQYKPLLDECGAKYRIMVLEGTPGNVILNVAEEEECDLIVMGSRGLTALENALMGSVATKVMQGAHCPVLITRGLRKHYPDHACFV